MPVQRIEISGSQTHAVSQQPHNPVNTLLGKVLQINAMDPRVKTLKEMKYNNDEIVFLDVSKIKQIIPVWLRYAEDNQNTQQGSQADRLMHFFDELKDGNTNRLIVENVQELIYSTYQNHDNVRQNVSLIEERIVPFESRVYSVEKCPRCGGPMLDSSKQLRSFDEPASFFLQCVNCKHRIAA